MAFRTFGVSVVVGILGCAGAQPSRSAERPAKQQGVLAQPRPAATQEPALTSLRTGAVPPVRAQFPVELELVAKEVGPEFETLWFQFRERGSALIDPTDVVLVPGATLAFLSQDPSGDGGLWIRRPSARANEPVTGEILCAADRGPGVRFELRVKSGTPTKPKTPRLESEFLRALAEIRRNEYRSSDVFSAFMDRRLVDMATAKFGKENGRLPVARDFTSQPENALHRLMETTTGRAQIQQAIQYQNLLRLPALREPRNLPLSAAPPPALPRADYVTMLAASGRTPPAEPLASAAPADFWYLRSQTFEAFLDLLDLVETWGQPTADILASRTEDRGTTARYTAELGLERTELARVLGPSVIESVGAVGSDPYVHDGTDVTLLFKLTAPPLFDAALAKSLSRHAAAHGGVTTSTFVHEGVTVRVARSPDGRVRQHRANVAGLELVSNSPTAIRRVISTALGKAPRLSEEADFRYLTARDGRGTDEVMAFLSDRFVLSAIGPGQKIAQARRQIALAELSAPGYAALLFGWLHGRSPKDEKELVKGRELLASELKHSDGSAIVWQPGKAASSRWGTTTELEPLIDLSRVEKISATEQRAYAEFSSLYRSLWSEYVDPVIVRLNRSKDVPGRLEVALRALPVLRADNRDLIEMVGSARVEAPPLDTGLRWVLAIGKEARLRRELDREASFAGRSLKFDWLGDSVTFGIADRPELTRVARAFLREELEPPSEETNRGDEFEALADIPAFASIEVKQRAGAVVALALLRKTAEDVARGMLEWKDGGKHRDIPIIEIAILRSGILKDGGSVYYALCPKALIISLHRGVLEALIDAELDGKAPRGVVEKPRPDAGQFVIELGTRKDDALIRVIGWLATAELVRRPEGRLSAEAILRGAPESRASADAFRSIARAYLGHVPLTPDGKLYEFSPEGVRDPLRGTPHAPIFPATPVPDSPLAAVLSRFVRVRTSISFDEEPGTGRQPDTRSFSVRMSLDLRK